MGLFCSCREPATLSSCGVPASHRSGFSLCFFKFLLIYHLFIFLAALGLCRCMWASSGCSLWGLLSSWGARVSHCGAFSCGAGTRGRRQAQQLRCTGSAALRHVGSSRSGDQIHAPCVGRQTLNQPTTGESLASLAAELGSLGAGFSISAR